MLANSGTGKIHPYTTSTLFTPHDIERYHNLYILQGLSTSPHTYMYFNTQKKDPKNGNDAVSSIFGPGAQNWFRNSKDFLGEGYTKVCATLKTPLKLEDRLVYGVDKNTY